MSAGEFGVLWTPMPMEIVLDQRVADALCIEVEMEGRLLLLRPCGDGTGVIERLVSSDPQDYLKPDLQPGTVMALP